MCDLICLFVLLWLTHRCWGPSRRCCCQSTIPAALRQWLSWKWGSCRRPSWLVSLCLRLPRAALPPPTFPHCDSAVWHLQPLNNLCVCVCVCVKGKVNWLSMVNTYLLMWYLICNGELWHCYFLAHSMSVSLNLILILFTCPLYRPKKTHPSSWRLSSPAAQRLSQWCPMSSEGWGPSRSHGRFLDNQEEMCLVMC